MLLEPDWDSVLHIVDCIRQGDVQPKVAVQSIKKKISNENPHVSLFALLVMEACVKNCGSTFHNEVATRDFCEFLKDQAKMRGDPVKEKILELIQTWSHAFRTEPKYKAVEDTFHLLKMEGHKFPAFKEADAMFDAGEAPQWKEGESCNRCRVKFGVVQRQHHCRNCGEVFCGKCSSKVTSIPKLGFEREVRVCDSCYDKINKTGTSAKKDDDLPAEYLASPLSKQSQAPPTKTEQEQQEEEELMLALALSKSEHETKEKERERNRGSYGNYGSVNNRASSPANTKATPVPAAMTAIDTSDMDPELARYLNRHYWQQKSEEQTPVTTVPSAPAPTPVTEARVSMNHVNETPQVVSSTQYMNGDTENEQTQFLTALQGSLEVLVNRMLSNSQRGRPIANDSAVQSLFAVISEMHPQLMTHIQEKEESRGYFEGLQDKLTQLRDAREALDSLREEHREKRRRELEELERQRQMQMMQKLEVMRQKKHEYLEMQRQLALQRLQEHEREMQARAEQQRNLTHFRQMQAFGYPQGYQQPMMGQQGVPPQNYQPVGGSTDGSPVHRINANSEAYPSMQMMTQAGGGTMGPQSGMYSMGSQPPIGPFAPPPSGAYQTDGQSMMPPQGYMPQDQSSMSLPAQQPMTGQMTSAPPNNMGPYAGVPGQMSTASLPSSQLTTAGMPNVQPQMGGMDAPMAYASLPPQSASDFQSFNMQGLSTALPSLPNSAMYGVQQQMQQQPPSQQFPATGAPPQTGYSIAPQQFPDAQYHQAAVTQQTQQPEPKQEAQLISFD